MSQIIGTVTQTADRRQRGRENWDQSWPYGQSGQPPNYLPLKIDWIAPWPTKSGTRGYDLTQMNAWQEALNWEAWTIRYGNSGYKTISGVTRDQGGNPVAGVTVGAYRTTDGVLECTATSDSAGNYALWVKTAGNYFVAGFINGPDRQGVTDNNIAGV